MLAASFYNHEHEWNVIVATEMRVQVSPTRIPIPDLYLVSNGPHPPVLVKPPLLAVEILSPDDTYSGMTQRSKDYIVMGVKAIWIIDAPNRTGHVWTAGVWKETPSLSVPGGSIHVELNAIFDQLELA